MNVARSMLAPEPDSIIEAKLAEPGAGLPRAELYVAKFGFWLRRLTGTPESFTAAFLQERQAIATQVRSCKGERARERVLIRRVRGLEDSSRYWSVWMTCDHLRIVNGHIAKVITGLMRGITPPQASSTAAVKPSPQVTAAVISEYEKACDDLNAAVAVSSQDLKTRARYAHPWFGPLDAGGWHALAATHMRIHRLQMERIIERLKTTEPHTPMSSFQSLE